MAEPPDSGSQRQYDAWHERMGASEDENPLTHPWYKTVFSHLGSDISGNLLEVGCGRGDFAVFLAKSSRSLRVTGIDFSSAAVDIAQGRAAKAGANATFRQGDALALPLADASFDWVVSCECMEHVKAPDQMAREICRVLRPGGRYCLTTENYFNGMLIAWIRTWLFGHPFDSGSGVQPVEHFFLYWQVARYLRSAGLVIDQTQSNHYQWLLLPRVNPARLRTNDVSNKVVTRLIKPFGRHFAFFGHKPG